MGFAVDAFHDALETVLARGDVALQKSAANFLDVALRIAIYSGIAREEQVYGNKKPRSFEELKQDLEPTFRTLNVEGVRSAMDFLNLGLAAANARHYREALQFSNLGVDRDPAFVELLTARTAVYRQLGQYKAAAQDGASALRLMEMRRSSWSGNHESTDPADIITPQLRKFENLKLYFMEVRVLHDRAGSLAMWAAEDLDREDAAAAWPNIGAARKDFLRLRSLEGDTQKRAMIEQSLIEITELEKAALEKLIVYKEVGKHQGEVFDIKIHPSNTIVASAGGDGLIKLWPLGMDNAQPRVLRGHGDFVLGIAFGPDGRRLASCGLDGTVRIWNVETGDPAGPTIELVSPGFTDFRCNIVFSPDGRWLVVATGSGAVRMWSTDTWKRATLPGGDDVTAIAFSPDGGRLASGDREGGITFWDAKRMVALGSREKVLDGAVTGLAYSQSGGDVAASDSGRAILLDVASGEVFGASLRPSTPPIKALTFAPDGPILAMGMGNGAVTLWDVASGQQIGSALPSHGDSYVPALSFSMDGKMLASASGDGRVRLWEFP